MSILTKKGRPNLLNDNLLKKVNEVKEGARAAGATLQHYFLENLWKDSNGVGGGGVVGMIKILTSTVCFREEGSFNLEGCEQRGYGGSKSLLSFVDIING